LHRRFNEFLPPVIEALFKMKRGALGPDAQLLFSSMTSNQNAVAKLEPLTTPKPWKPRKKQQLDETWVQAAVRLREGRGILFDRFEAMPDVSSEFRRKVFEMAFACVDGHLQLVKRWRKEHEDWLKQKERWERGLVVTEEGEDEASAETRTWRERYMRLRPLFEEFEQRGVVRRNRRRWHEYIEFLSTHPAFAEFRPNALTDQERADLRDPIARFERLLEKNADLERLDNLHGQYQDLIRPWARKRNPDGFKHRPTFTMPSVASHPQWFSFKKSATYKNLDLEKGVLALALGKEGAKAQWVTVRLATDPRLARFRPAQRVGKGKRARSWVYLDPISGEEFDAEVRGLKLMFPKGIQGPAYLMFTVQLSDRPRQVVPRKDWTPPEGLLTLACDFGQRHLGAITMCRYENGSPVQVPFTPAYLDHGRGRRTPSKPVSAWLPVIPGLRFDDIREHELEISARLSATYGDPRSRRQGGVGASRGRHAAAGSRPFAQLRRHIDEMREVHFKKAAHLIVATALKNGAQVVIMEFLANYRPDLERSHRENRARMIWAVRRIQEFVEQTAALYGIAVRTPSPYLTSQVCSACGSPGARFTRPSAMDWTRKPPGRKESWYEKRFGPKAKAVIEPGGPWFCCSNPNCPRPCRVIQADINASLNLHRRFYERFDLSWLPDGKPARKQFWGRLKGAIQAYLDQFDSLPRRPGATSHE
jgi:IS605 OrfB family transposase